MLLLGTVLLAPLVHAQDRQLPPVDEAAGDVSWLRFKKQLMNAIEKKDKQFLLSILDRNVRNQDERTRGIAKKYMAGIGGARESGEGSGE